MIKIFLLICVCMGSFLFGENSVVILLGAPGAGKGTQAMILKEKYGLPHIATGDLFRENLKANTPIGQKAKGYMEQGKLVPDEIVIEMLNSRLAKEDCKKGFMLDGFPRTLSQAEMLEKTLQGRSIIVLDIEVPDAVILDRLTGRLTCEICGAPFHKTTLPPKKEGICDQCGGKLIQRKDDKEEVIKARLAVYHTQTKPLIQYYKAKGVLFVIDGCQSKEGITSQIDAILGK